MLKREHDDKEESEDQATTKATVLGSDSFEAKRRRQVEDEDEETEVRLNDRQPDLNRT